MLLLAVLGEFIKEILIIEGVRRIDKQ